MSQHSICYHQACSYRLPHNLTWLQTFQAREHSPSFKFHFLRIWLLETVKRIESSGVKHKQVTAPPSWERQWALILLSTRPPNSKNLTMQTEMHHILPKNENYWIVLGCNLLTSGQWTLGMIRELRDRPHPNACGCYCSWRYIHYLLPA